MRSLVLLLLVACSAATRPAPSPAAPVDPRYERIDTFGSHTLDRDTLLAHHGPELAGLLDQPFDAELGRRKVALEQTIAAEGHFTRAAITIITYYQPTRSYLTVDIVEPGSAAPQFSPEPTQTLPDPGGLLAAWTAYEKAFMDALTAGQPVGGKPEDCGRAWHCLGFATRELASYRAVFDEGVPAHEAELAEVLRNDHRAGQRAAAAFLLAHLTSGPRVVELMLPAITDPEELVRNNALRVLAIMALRHPEVPIPLAPIISALHGPTTLDRNKASAILSGLAKHPELHAAIRAGAGATLVDMLALHQPNNHDFAYTILKEISGRDLGEHDVAAWRAWLRS